MDELSNARILRSNRKTLTLQILPDASIVIKAPLRISDREINSFIQKHQDWIRKRLVHAKNRNGKKRVYQDGEEFLYLGKKYLLKSGQFAKITLDGEFLLIPEVIHFRIQKELTNWYIKQAKEVITQQVENYAKEMSTSFGSLLFSDTRSKWGSCTHENNLQFSWRLIMAPMLVLRYVVIHELAHTIEKNHSRSFWNIVKKYNPSYKQQIKWLKEQGNSLVI